MSTTRRSCDSHAPFADLETRLFTDAPCAERRVVAFIRDVRTRRCAAPANVRTFLPRPPLSGVLRASACEAVLLRAC